MRKMKMMMMMIIIIIIIIIIYAEGISNITKSQLKTTPWFL